MTILKGIKINSTTAREFIFFLLLTTLVAGLIKLSKTYVTDYELSVHITELPLNKTVRSISPKKIKVNASATGFSLLRNSVESSQTAIAFSKMKVVGAGQYTYVLKDHIISIQNGLDGAININSTSPEEIVVLIDSMASKKVPVVPEVAISYSPGYGKKSELTIQPDSITIVGPTAILDKVDVVHTVAVTINDVDADIDQKVAFKEIDSEEVLKYSDNKVQVSQQVTRFAEGVVKVPVKVINDTDGTIKILPKTVEIIYTVELDDFDTVSSSDFLVTCTYVKNSSTNNYLPLTIARSPDNVSAVRLSDKQVQFIVIN